MVRMVLFIALLMTTQSLQAQQPVEVGESVVRDVALSLKLVGTVEPLLASTVSSEIAGRIEVIWVE